MLSHQVGCAFSRCDVVSEMGSPKCHKNNRVVSSASEEPQRRLPLETVLRDIEDHWGEFLDALQSAPNNGADGSQTFLERMGTAQFEELVGNRRQDTQNTLLVDTLGDGDKLELRVRCSPEDRLPLSESSLLHVFEPVVADLLAQSQVLWVNCVVWDAVSETYHFRVLANAKSVGSEALRQLQFVHNWAAQKDFGQHVAHLTDLLFGKHPAKRRPVVIQRSPPMEESDLLVTVAAACVYDILHEAIGGAQAAIKAHLDSAPNASEDYGPLRDTIYSMSGVTAAAQRAGECRVKLCDNLGLPMPETGSLSDESFCRYLCWLALCHDAWRYYYYLPASFISGIPAGGLVIATTGPLSGHDIERSQIGLSYALAPISDFAGRSLRGAAESQACALGGFTHFGIHHILTSCGTELDDLDELASGAENGLDEQGLTELSAELRDIHTKASAHIDYIKQVSYFLKILSGPGNTDRISERLDINAKITFFLEQDWLHERMQKPSGTVVTAELNAKHALLTNFSGLEGGILLILENLLRNAYTRIAEDPDSTRRVLVRTHDEEDWLVVTVSNYGQFPYLDDKGRTVDIDFIQRRIRERLPGDGKGLRTIGCAVEKLGGGCSVISISDAKDSRAQELRFEVRLPPKSALPRGREHPDA